MERYTLLCKTLRGEIKFEALHDKRVFLCMPNRTIGYLGLSWLLSTDFSKQREGIIPMCMHIYFSDFK